MDIPTRCLMKNKSWFEKILRHFQKTIRRFQKTIRHFQKTTRRLKRSQYSLTQHDQLGYEQQVRSVSENRCEIIVEYFLFSRAYAYTQEFYLFCCHCCHSFLWISLFCNILRTSFGHLLIDKRSTSQNQPITTTKNTFSPFLLLIFSTFSLLVWHLWQQKNEIAVVYARACARYAQAQGHQHFLQTFCASLFRQVFPSGFFELIFRVNLSLRFPWSQTKHTPKTPNYATSA